MLADAAAPGVAEFAAEVRDYLTRTPRQLPSRYFYDELGSALFEAICRLPWYRIMRSESRLLETHAAAIVSFVGRLSAIVELGSGSGEKLRMVVDAAGPQRDPSTGLGARPLDVHLVDLSSSALSLSSRTLASAEGICVTAHQASYEAGLLDATRHRAREGQTLVLFLGSNIGNFDAPAAENFLRGLRQAVRPGDSLLLGTDLVKTERELLLAYDDPLGVTAAFNRNLLVRINRELDADFAVDDFAHLAVWNEAASRVEMHLVARAPQSVRIGAAALDVRFENGESIWTESSHKYRPSQVSDLLAGADFDVVAQWVDADDGFALTLAGAVSFS